MYSDDSTSQSYELPEQTKYDILDDSLNKLEQASKQLKYTIQRKKSNLMSVGGMSGPGIGIFEYTDTTSGNKKPFLVCVDFGLEQSQLDYYKDFKYYFENGKSYLRVPIITKINKQNYKISYNDKVVTFRYDTQENQILIPIQSNIGFVTASIVCYFLGGLGAFIIIFGALLIMKFLFSISRNKVFDLINIRRLFWVAICCFATVILPYLVSLILYIIYFKTLSIGTTFTKALSKGDIQLSLLGVLFIALYIAFKKGHQLKRELDLTI